MHGDNTHSSRQLLRRTLRMCRRNLSPAEQRRASRALLSHWPLTRELARVRHIAFYDAVDGEIDPSPLMQRCLRSGKRVYLPVLKPGNRLDFYRFRPGGKTLCNRLGIREPHRRNKTQLHKLDLVVTPLVGFDARGHRLGMGGGFYDRSFAFKRGMHKKARPRLVGLAHECQRVEMLVQQPWDVALWAVATPSDWIRSGVR